MIDSSALQAEASQILEREAVAFRAMHAELLSQYPNDYVAIHQVKLLIMARTWAKFIYGLMKNIPTKLF